MLDPGWVTLIEDLKLRGLLETTLIVWMGEFGRTPAINKQSGRDHFPAAWTTVLAGGGIAGGRTISNPPGSTAPNDFTTHQPKGGPPMRGALQARAVRLPTTITGLRRPSWPSFMALRRRHVSGEELEIIERLSSEARRVRRSGDDVRTAVSHRYWR